MRKVRGRLSLLIGLYIVVSLTGLVSPYIMGQFIDRLLAAECLVFIGNEIILLAALELFEFFMSIIRVQLEDDKTESTRRQACADNRKRKEVKRDEVFADSRIQQKTGTLPTGTGLPHTGSGLPSVQSLLHR